MNKSNKTETKNGTTELLPSPPAKASPQTKRYDEALKKAAVENWIKSGKLGTVIAAELGVSYPSLKSWKDRYYGDATPERDTLEAENRALKRELARVSEQRDILKKRWASSANRRATLRNHCGHEEGTSSDTTLCCV